MADDPNRDILPVREGSCMDTCRSSIDIRERHIVCKLDRYELEDRYLRLLEEANSLKKLTHCQEDKIKRLATKLMRLTANPRSCAVALEIYENKNKIISLELENSKLKDKISVLRNQLLSHTIAGRSSSRSRNPQARPSSGRITCRSENSRTKVPSCHCISEIGKDDSDVQNKIEELEAEKKEMSNRIAQLEKELSTYTVVSQREKVAENVEYIRVWRQMKQLNDKLIAAENKNESLNAQINDLKRMLEEKTKNNEAITTELLIEKKRTAEIDEEMLKTKGSQLSLREKDEQIKDLLSEIKILQQHNNELIELSSKYGEVELENKELKKKVTEQLHNQESLKTAFSTEQANIVALQVSNEQLLGKLGELQKNIDSLTVQLTSFQAPAGNQETPKTTQISTKQADTKISIATDKHVLHKDTVNETVKCSKCCEVYEKLLQVDTVNKKSCKTCCKTLEGSMYTSQKIQIRLMDKSIQTECELKLDTMERKEERTMPFVKEKLKMEEAVPRSMESATVTENYLTPEKMLQFLEQAQISTPLDTMRFAQKNVASNVDYDILDQNQRHSGTDTLVQAPQESTIFQLGCQQRESKSSCNIQSLDEQSADPSKILSLLYNILRQYSLTYTVPNEASSLYRPVSSLKCRVIKDINNNIDTMPNNIATSAIRTSCNARKFCSSPYYKQERPKKKAISSMKRYNRVHKVADNIDCTCNNLMKCNEYSNCDQHCCNSMKSVQCCGSKNPEVHYGVGSIMNKNYAEKSAPSLQSNQFGSLVYDCDLSRNVNTMYILRQSHEEAGPYKSWKMHEVVQTGNDVSDTDETLHDYIKQLDKCKQLVNGVTGIPVGEAVSQIQFTDPIRHHGIHKETKSEAQKIDSFCSVDCPNECPNVTNAASDSFPLLIADGQGLVELHIVSLQLSTCAKQILFREKDISNVSLFVSWDIWNQETAFTPTLKCPRLNFNSSFVYRIPDLFSFFNYILLEFVSFQVNVFHEDNDNYVVARGKLCIKDILDYPQNKLHYIAPVNSVIPCSIGMNFGQLSLWVRLSCDIEKVEAFKKRHGIRSQSTEEGPELTRKESAQKLLPPAKSEELTLKTGSREDDDVQDNSKFLASRRSSASKATFINESSDASRETHSVISQPNIVNEDLTVMKESDDGMYSNSKQLNHVLRDRQSIFAGRVKWEEPSGDNTEDDLSKRNLERLKSKETLDRMMKKKELEASRPSKIEFNAFMSNVANKDVDHTTSVGSIQEVGHVISEKNWNKYKDRSYLTFVELNNDDTEHVESKSTNELLPENDTITIEIVDLILFPKSYVMLNDEYQLLYIEYCFLGNCGADMETVSIRKPIPPNQKITYNFKKKFHVDESKHLLQSNILRAMLDNTINPNIKFIVVCEPLPEETETKECVEVGYANFNLRDYALSNSEKAMSIPVFRPNSSEQIGLLKVSVTGLDVIRQRLAHTE